LLNWGWDGLLEMFLQKLYRYNIGAIHGFGQLEQILWCVLLCTLPLMVDFHLYMFWKNITIETHDRIYRKAVKFLIPYLYSHPFAEIG
jgi:hypothetical protein